MGARQHDLCETIDHTGRSCVERGAHRRSLQLPGNCNQCVEPHVICFGERVCTKLCFMANSIYAVPVGVVVTRYDHIPEQFNSHASTAVYASTDAVRMHALIVDAK
jgi:hypothetical protein